MDNSKMAIAIWITGDQLLHNHPVIEAGIETHGKENLRIVLVESQKRIFLRPFQKKRAVLVLSGMRHYVEELKVRGFQAELIQADSFLEGIDSFCKRHNCSELHLMRSAEYQMRRYQENKFAKDLGRPVTLFENVQFLVGRFNPYPDPQEGKRYVMENFYREMRKHYDVLMTPEGDPKGGAWNYDKENRKKLPKNHQPPEDILFEPDEITRQVIEEVDQYPQGIGKAAGFGYAVTRQDALKAADFFFTTRMTLFGPYEDALTTRSHTLYHSVLSPYLNIGLLEPLELIHRAEAMYDAGEAPINSVEGFVRQIIGWREFMYWQYWRQMPGMKEKNSWEATRALPAFFWTGETDLKCLNHAISRAIDTGYNHHIERLMVLSNFCMLAGINPAEVNDWFMDHYIDAFDWVMPPNVIGMALNADGGLTATKPYIASANYINKMGDLCSSCSYNHKKRVGEDACPFNFLYWRFILKHETLLRSNPRLGKNVLGLRHLSESDKKAVVSAGDDFLDTNS